MNRYSKSPSAIIVFTMLALLILLLLPLTVNSSKEYSPISENSILPQQCCLEFNGTRAFTY
ncbi:MAG: hypothetical protein ACFFDE_08360, partial [Promethearchaeota archaeon]